MSKLKSVSGLLSVCLPTDNNTSCNQALLRGLQPLANNGIKTCLKLHRYESFSVEECFLILQFKMVMLPENDDVFENEAPIISQK